MTQKPGKDRELEELALGNDRDIRSESQEGQGLPRGLVVCDNQARSDRDILLSLLDVGETNTPPEKVERPLSPGPGGPADSALRGAAEGERKRRGGEERRPEHKCGVEQP